MRHAIRVEGQGAYEEGLHTSEEEDDVGMMKTKRFSAWTKLKSQRVYTAGRTGRTSKSDAGEEADEEDGEDENDCDVVTSPNTARATKHDTPRYDKKRMNSSARPVGVMIRE